MNCDDINETNFFRSLKSRRRNKMLRTKWRTWSTELLVVIVIFTICSISSIHCDNVPQEVYNFDPSWYHSSSRNSSPVRFPSVNNNADLGSPYNGDNRYRPGGFSSQANLPNDPVDIYNRPNSGSFGINPSPNDRIRPDGGLSDNYGVNGRPNGFGNNGRPNGEFVRPFGNDGFNGGVPAVFDVNRRPGDPTLPNRPFDPNGANRPLDVNAANRPFVANAAIRPFDPNYPVRPLDPNGPIDPNYPNRINPDFNPVPHLGDNTFHNTIPDNLPEQNKPNIVYNEVDKPLDTREYSNINPPFPSDGNNLPNSLNTPGPTQHPGGIIANKVSRLEKHFSPYLIKNDIIVESTGELIIEPGVEVRFAPTIGITVRGVLTAKVRKFVIYSLQVAR